MTDPASADPRAAWPTPHQVVGVWAGAVTQLWDISLSWWGVAIEMGSGEDPRLTPWSTTCEIAASPNPAARYTCTAVATIDGTPVPRECVTAVLSVAGPAGGESEVQVVAQLPAADGGTILEFTIAECDAGGAPTGTERTYLRGFGVPGT